MPKKLSPASDALYNINSRIVLGLGLILLLVVNYVFYREFQDEVQNGITSINKQLMIQRELLDEGMGLMFNSVYLQRSWVQERLNNTSHDQVKGSITDCIAYNPDTNISSLDAYIPEDEYRYGNIFIQGDVKNLEPHTLEEIERIKNIFELQRFLRENSSFATWSTYYTNRYITMYPFNQSVENIENERELFTAVDQAIGQLNHEKNRDVFEKGWETDIFLDHTGHIFMFSKNLPVLREDKVAGIIAVNLSVGDIQNYINQSGELEVYVVDSGNHVVYCNGRKIESIQTLQEVFYNQYKLKELNLKAILNKDTTPKINDRYFLTAQLQNANWKLVYVVPENLIESPVCKRYTQYAVANLLIVVGIALICMLLAKYSQKAMEIARLKDEFLMTVSHDLKSPLASIIGFNEMIINKLEGIIFPAVNNGDEKTNQAVERIRRNTSIIETEGLRLTELINNLLDLSVLEYGETILKREPAPVRQIIEDALKAVQPLIKSKGLDCYIEAEPNLPPVGADREKIMQVLVNLLTNAVKFTEQGYIKCSARADHNRVVFCVEDTGAGIPDKYRDTIFDKFIKVEDGSGAQKGTGLGLAICQNIVNQHGGKIWLESEAGKGSRFFFQIPVYQE